MTTKITGDNIGIGTTSPEGKLHVVNDQGGGTGRIIFDANVSSGYNTKIDATDTGLEFTAQSNSRGFAFNTGLTPTEKVRIQAGGGISFNGDTAAANALDDYEEGTWTPVYSGATTSGTYTYANQLGTYTKVGNKVTCHASLTDITTVGAGSGALRIKGLPFTSLNASIFPHGVIRCSRFGVNSTAVDMNCTVVANNTQLSVVEVVASGSAQLTQVTDKVDNSADIYLSVTYEAA